MQNNNRVYFVAAVVFAATFIMRVLPGPVPIDDAYITYRIADNLGSGNGFVYNVGERLQSSTTPAYAIFLAIFAMFGLDIVVVSFLMNALFAGLSALMLFLVCFRLTSSLFAAFGATILYAVFPGSVIYSVAGMETMFFEMLMIASVTAYFFRRNALACLLGGIAPLARPEGIVVAGIIGLGLLYEKRRGAWRYALIGAIPLSVWIVWATWYYGTPIPHSVSEKADFFTHSRFAVGFLGFLRQWIYHYYSLFWDQPIDLQQMWVTTYGRTILLGAPFAFGAVWLVFSQLQGRARGLAFSMLPILYVLFVLVGQAGLPFQWYFVPPSGLLIAASISGLYLFLHRFFGRYRAFPWAFLGIALMLSLNHLSAHYVRGNGFHPKTLYRHVPLHREAVYIEAANWMAQRGYPSSELVICAEVGAIGYFCDYKVWDLLLTTPPDVTERGEELVDRYAPRFITFMGMYPKVPALREQPDSARLGTNNILYVRKFTVNSNELSNFAARHNVVVYERQ